MRRGVVTGSVLQSCRCRGLLTTDRSRRGRHPPSAEGGHVWPGSPLFRRKRDQVGLFRSTASTGPRTSRPLGTWRRLTRYRGRNSVLVGTSAGLPASAARPRLRNEEGQILAQSSAVT